jgi:hypothetical protein
VNEKVQTLSGYRSDIVPSSVCEAALPFSGIAADVIAPVAPYISGIHQAFTFSTSISGIGVFVTVAVGSNVGSCVGVGGIVDSVVGVGETTRLSAVGVMLPVVEEEPEHADNTPLITNIMTTKSKPYLSQCIRAPIIILGMNYCTDSTTATIKLKDIAKAKY